MSKECFIVTVCTNLDTDDLGWPNLGNTNTVGIFDNIDRARQVVCENVCDIWETCYDYAFIEEWDLNAVYGATLQVEFYKFDRKEESYKLIDKPDKFNNFLAFSCITNLREGRKKE